MKVPYHTTIFNVVLLALYAQPLVLLGFVAWILNAKPPASALAHRAVFLSTISAALLVLPSSWLLKLAVSLSTIFMLVVVILILSSRSTLRNHPQETRTRI